MHGHIISFDLGNTPTSALVVAASELPEPGLMAKSDGTGAVLLWAAPLFWKKKKILVTFMKHTFEQPGQTGKGAV